MALLAVTVQLPFVGRGLSLLDEGSVLATAEAVAQGEVLYRDRLTVVAPLVYELLGAAFSAFGATLATARVFQAALFVASVLLVLGVLRRLASEGWAVAGALSLLALKPLAFQLWTMANYSQLALATLLLALWALLRWLERRRLRDLALAGFASGLVFLAKQNLGAVAALAVAGTVLADWARARPRRLAPLGARAGVLLAASLVPVCGFALRQAEQGALAETWLRAVVNVSTLAGDWLLPFPPLSLWDRGDADFRLRIFAYYPAPLVELGLAGGLDLWGAPLSRAIEWAVKLCYALPPLAVLLLLARFARAPECAPGALACALFAAGCYASIGYRADWAHLMNVWPVLHVALVGALAASGPRLRTPFAAGAGLAWLGLAGLACWALLALDWATLRTPRGELRAGSASVRSVEAVLAFASAQAPEEDLAFLPAVPGLHFLAGRPLPLATDALIPGLFEARDEERLLAQLDGVERVVWDRRPLPWVEADAIDVAPRIAQALATQFRFSHRLAPEFLAFERNGRSPLAPAHALWERATLAPGATAEHWLFHRVLAFALRAGERRCVELPWRAAAGERLVATPMSHPSLWDVEAPRLPIEFALTVLDPERRALASRKERLSSEAPGQPWQLPLPPGTDTTLRFCAALPAPAGLAGELRAEAGFAEPRVEGGVATAPAGARRP